MAELISIDIVGGDGSITNYELNRLDYGPVEIKRTSSDGSIHREVVNPDSDISHLPQSVQDAITAWWTPVILQAWQDFKNSQNPPPVVTERDVYFEMFNRIDRRYPPPIGPLMARRATRLIRKPGYPGSLTVDETAELAEIDAVFDWMQAMWNRYKVLRGTLPLNYQDDAQWPSPPPTGTYWE